MQTAPPTPRARRNARALARAAGIALVCSLALTAAAQDQRDVEIPEDTPEQISFAQFSEPVSLAALTDWIGEMLDVNFILQEPGLAGAEVEFRAQQTIPREQLFPFYEAILSQYGYALTQTPEGVYLITQGNRVPVNLQGELPSTRIFSTPLVKPSALVQMINNALGQDAQGSVRLASVDELGMLISTAPGPINRTIADLIERIVQGRAGWQLHRLPLDHVAASDARQRILEFAGQLAPRAQDREAAQQAAAQGGALTNLSGRLIIDRAANALIFRGSEQERIQVAELVGLIDEPSELIVRRYDAGQMSSAIAGYGERLGLGPVSQAQQGQRAADVALGSGFAIEAAEAGFFTYYGTEEQHARVETLVDEFADQVRAEAMVVEFYKLEHADAESAAELLQELMDLETADDFAESPFLPPSLEQRRSQSNITRVDDIVGREPTPPEGQQPDVGERPAEGGQQQDDQTLTPVEGIQIIADTAANQLVVRAPVRQQGELASIIERVDQRRPQVFIEATIVTVNASENFNITVDTALTDPDGDFPVFTNFGLIEDPRDTTINPIQGFTAAVINNDYVPLIINALQSEGDGRVLSTPRLLVNDNEEANIQSVTEQPFSQTTQTVGTPSQTGLGGTVSAGTLLSVTPQISSGGFLNLEFSVELSSFLERINQDLPPPTRSDNVESVVTVPSGSTVVIGGLTFESRNDSISKIPILGDIPLLGILFQSRTEDSSLRTLYVFLTPRVLRDDNFADLRLLTEGALSDAELKKDLPLLQPASIPLIEGRPEGYASDERSEEDDTAG